MKYFLGILCIVLLPNKEIFSTKQCTGLKKGTFVTTDDKVGKTIIQRNDTIQFEENKILGIKYLEKIKWINDCSFEVHSIIVIENKNNLRVPSGSIIVSLEQLNDSVFNQTTLMKKYNYKHLNKITKISDDVNLEFKKLIAESN